MCLQAIGQVDPEICSGNELSPDGPTDQRPNAVTSFNLFCDRMEADSIAPSVAPSVTAEAKNVFPDVPCTIRRYQSKYWIHSAMCIDTKDRDSI